MLCLIARLDGASADKLEAIRRAKLPDGVETKPFYAHVTLATYVGENERQFIEACKEWMKRIPAFDIEYEKLEVLTETAIIVATPVKSEILSSLHRFITDRYNEELDFWTKEDRWYPHTTLLIGTQSDVQVICLEMKELFTPFLAHINRFEFSRVFADGYEIVDGLDLTP